MSLAALTIQPPDGYRVTNLNRWHLWCIFTDVPVCDYADHLKTVSPKKLKSIGIATSDTEDDFWDDDFLSQPRRPNELAHFWVSSRYTKGTFDPWHHIARRDFMMQATTCIIKARGVTPWEKRSYLRQEGDPILLPYDTAPRDVLAAWKLRQEAA